MLTDSPNFAPAQPKSAFAHTLNGLAELDARRLLAGTRTVGSAHPPADAPLRMALARELRLAELLAGQRLVVDDLPAHIIRAALAVYGLADESDELSRVGETGAAERLTAWEAAGALVGVLVTSCELLEHRGHLGSVSQLHISGEGCPMRVVAVPAQGHPEAHVAVDELDACGRRLGAVDVRRLVGATIEDAVPMTGALPDEARAVWLRASAPAGGPLHALILARSDVGGSASATLVFEQCRVNG
jgi:hypothetical protein